jgi:hypothetical protein
MLRRCGNKGVDLMKKPSVTAYRELVYPPSIGIRQLANPNSF